MASFPDYLYQYHQQLKRISSAKTYGRFSASGIRTLLLYSFHDARRRPGVQRLLRTIHGDPCDQQKKFQKFASVYFTRFCPLFKNSRPPFKEKFSNQYRDAASVDTQITRQPLQSKIALITGTQRRDRIENPTEERRRSIALSSWEPFTADRIC